jgi:predicted  nucleic acid-binding Zn-ribbon protein
MDEAVDQVMGRSQDEKGAEKANNIRKSQQRDRSALAKDIETNQKLIATLNDEAAPIRAEVRKVEAEVGPIKYIAKFIYGDHGADENMLEKAVTWIIVLIVVVFDPLAVIMLLAAQMTFGWKREEPAETPPVYVADVSEKPTEEEKEPENIPAYEPDDGPLTDNQIEQIKATVEAPKEETSETPLTALGGDITAPEEPEVPNTTESELDKWNKMIEEAEYELAQEAIKQQEAKRYHPEVATANSYTEVTGDRLKPDLTEVIEPESEESKKKTYMIKDESGTIQVKARE